MSTFGRVREVHNLARDARTRAWFTEQRRVNHNETSEPLTERKRSDELSYLGVVSSVPPHVHTWTCGGCGTTHARYVNAAQNIEAAGLAVSACGAGVRPQRESSRTGQSAGKQEPSGASRKTIPALQGA
nr:transposase [Actinopolyspora erythraea]